MTNAAITYKTTTETNECVYCREENQMNDGSMPFLVCSHAESQTTSPITTAILTLNGAPCDTKTFYGSDSINKAKAWAAPILKAFAA